MTSFRQIEAQSTQRAQKHPIQGRRAAADFDSDPLISAARRMSPSS
jgi:hypothetical protein